MAHGNAMALTVWSVNWLPNQTSVVGVQEIRVILEKHADSAVDLNATASADSYAMIPVRQPVR